MLISPDIYFKTTFEWLSLAQQFASLTPYAFYAFTRFLNTDISQGTVATRVGCGRVFGFDFVTNCLLSLTVKEF